MFNMAPESGDFILIKNVSKKFGGNYALRDVSATIGSGEILGLIGRSGAGKSVLINMLRGSADYRPDAGKVIYRFNSCKACGWTELPFDGIRCGKCGSEMEIKEVDFWALDEEDPLRAQIRRRIAIMLRTYLFGEMTVIENIFELLESRCQKERIDRALELLKMVKLDHRVTHIGDLSEERSSAAFGPPARQDPILFLADEPTGTLDPQTAEIVHNVLVVLFITGYGHGGNLRWPRPSTQWRTVRSG